jgi:tRNA/tmRNA/rRNA uracil-C5-methylase (TrmA/RlmC/RlmD family)/23S rRNA-/tRNA-specific pseudouridylate synthase
MRTVSDLDERIRCAHADGCSGCPLIDLPYADQLARKRDRVRRAVARYPSLGDLAVDPPNAAVQRGYRIRAKLVVAPRARVGLFAKNGGHVVVDIPECRVMSPALLDVAARLRQLLASPPAAAGRALIASDAHGSGALSAVDLREIAGGGPANVLVTLVFDVERRPAAAMLTAAAAALTSAAPSVAGVAASFRREGSPQVLGSVPHVICGPSAMHDALDGTGLFHRATYGSFAQAHPVEAGRIRDVLVRELGAVTGGVKKRTVLELYGGSGSVALTLAALHARVTLVDAFAPAADGAKVAARDQGLSGIAVRVGDAARVAHDLARGGDRFDAIVANPPRAGIPPAGRQAMADLSPTVIAYVSCDPDTLARDLDHFFRLGYRTDRLRTFDLLPMTDHVETLAMLHPGCAPPPRVAYEDDAMAIVEKAAHEAVSGSGRGTLLGRAAVVSGFARMQPVSPLPPGASGLVVLAKSPAAAGPLAAAVHSSGFRGPCLLGVRGVTARTGTIKLPNGRARYRRIGVASGHSLVGIDARSVHVAELLRGFARIGHPVLGDTRFGDPSTNRHFEQKFALCRPFVHRTRIELASPETGTPVAADCPLPGDLSATLERMGLDPTRFPAPTGDEHLGHARTAD